MWGVSDKVGNDEDDPRFEAILIEAILDIKWSMIQSDMILKGQLKHKTYQANVYILGHQICYHISGANNLENQSWMSGHFFILYIYGRIILGRPWLGEVTFLDTWSNTLESISWHLVCCM